MRAPVPSRRRLYVGLGSSRWVLVVGFGTSRPGHKAKDCNQPKRPKQATPDTQCHNCSELGHIASASPKPRSFNGRCWGCGEMGHPKQACPNRQCPRYKEFGHGIEDCEGEDRRECHVCKEPGHPAKECPRTRFNFTMPHVAANKKQRDATKENREPPAKPQWARGSDDGHDNGDTDKTPAADDLKIGDIDIDNMDFENFDFDNAAGNDGAGNSAAIPTGNDDGNEGSGEYAAGPTDKEGIDDVVEGYMDPPRSASPVSNISSHHSLAATDLARDPTHFAWEGRQREKSDAKQDRWD